MFQIGLKSHLLRWGKKIFTLSVLPSLGIVCSCCKFLMISEEYFSQSVWGGDGICNFFLGGGETFTCVFFRNYWHPSFYAEHLLWVVLVKNMMGNPMM